MTNHTLDTEFLSEEQDSDLRVRVYASPANSEFISLQIDTDNPSGTLTITLEIDDAKKLATRIWTATKLARGELQEIIPRHRN
jgi:phage-related tail fiber protein